MAGASGSAGTGASAGGSTVAKVYWTDVGAHKIQRANPDGSQVEDVVVGLDEPQQIAIDHDSDKLYWAELSPDAVVRRANLDGSDMETLIAGGGFPGVGKPRGIALDLASNKMYFAGGENNVTGGGGIVARANMDGSDVELLVPDRNEPRGVTLHHGDDKIYWAELLGVQRANLDGTGIEQATTSQPIEPYGLALDEAAGQLYWTDRSMRAIGRTDLATSIGETLLQNSTADFVQEPKGIALDIAHDAMYWVDETTGTVHRARLDGSDAEALVTGLIEPPGLALLFE